MDESATDVNPYSIYENNSSFKSLPSGNYVELESELLQPYYDMSGDKLMIIFNHFQYKKTRYFGGSKPPERKGTAQDVKRLHQVFEGLGFKVVTHQDLSYEDIIGVTIEVTNRDHTTTSCIAVVILTHGSVGGELSAADMPYQLSDVLAFYQNGHKSLVGKPKLFFIQACRGDKMDSGRVVTDGEGRTSRLLPTHADFLILYSTVEDYVSWRDKEGSWLIQELCNVIEEHKNKLDILQMVTLVNHRVAYERASYTLNRKMLDKKQMPETNFTLTKLLKF